MVQGDLGLWSASYGPYTKSKARKADDKLRALGLRTTYATRNDAIAHDSMGVAILES
jgi:hypothetical protein